MKKLSALFGTFVAFTLMVTLSSCSASDDDASSKTEQSESVTQDATEESFPTEEQRQQEEWQEQIQIAENLVEVIKNPDDPYMVSFLDADVAMKLEGSIYYDTSIPDAAYRNAQRNRDDVKRIEDAIAKAKTDTTEENIRELRKELKNLRPNLDAHIRSFPPDEKGVTISQKNDYPALDWIINTPNGF